MLLLNAFEQSAILAVSYVISRSSIALREYQSQTRSSKVIKFKVKSTFSVIEVGHKARRHYISEKLFGYLKDIPERYFGLLKSYPPRVTVTSLYGMSQNWCANLLTRGFDSVKVGHLSPLIICYFKKRQ